jgi:hypothetical protein
MLRTGWGLKSGRAMRLFGLEAVPETRKLGPMEMAFMAAAGAACLTDTW